MIPKPLTDKEKLLFEIGFRKRMKTSDVIKWGVANYSNRALRNMQQLAQTGKVRRMSDEEKLALYGEIGEGVFEYVSESQRRPEFVE